MAYSWREEIAGCCAMIKTLNNVSSCQTPQKETGPVEGPDSEVANTHQTEAVSVAIVSQRQPTNKEFSTWQAKAARRGHELTAKQHPAGLTIWTVARWGQARSFADWGDALDFLRRIGA